MATQPNNTAEHTITLDVPQREGKEGYIGTIFGLYLRLGGIMSDPGFRETDIRLYYMAKLLINLIPGKKNRAEIKERMKKEIETALKDVKDNETRMRLKNEICLDYIGEVHDFMDKHLGVSAENRIGFVVRPEKKQ